jgi:hypothetical protein
MQGLIFVFPKCQRMTADSGTKCLFNISMQYAEYTAYSLNLELNIM